MHKAILVGALLLAAGSVAALPATSNILAAAGTGPLTGDIIVKVLGYRPESGPVTTYGPDGPVTRTVTFEELTEALAMTSLGGSGSTDGPVQASRCAPGGIGIYCGPDVGQGTLNAGPFCDNSSAWISSSGATSYYSILSGPKPTTVVTCGDFFGKTFDWDEVELDALTANLNADLNYEGCFSTTWTIHSNGYCANVGSPTDTFVWHWRATGTGVAANLFGNFDYFLGNGATTAYDLPAGVGV